MIENVVIGAELRVPMSMVDMGRIQSELYIKNKATAAKDRMGLKRTARDYDGIELYRISGKYVFLPRGYRVPYLQPVETEQRVVGDVVGMRPFRLSLRQWQHKPAQVLMDTPGDKTLCLGCGKGKSILALWYAERLTMRTLILVDRDFLLDQWRGYIKKCFGYRIDEIAIWKGGKKPPKQADFTIAMIHTLRNRTLDKAWCEQFGLVIVDENHVASAPSFQKLIVSFPGERLGLSATPDRKDGMHPTFLLHCGGLKPCYTDLSRFQPAHWYFRSVPRPAGLTDKILSAKAMSWMPVAEKRVINRAKLDSLLATPQFGHQWLKLMVQDIRTAALEGRTCLVLGTRTEQLSEMTRMLQEVGVDAGYVDAFVKGKERKAAFRCQVILATEMLASKALDKDILDTLFLLYPQQDEGFIRQAAGRLDRPKEGKFEPMIVTYVHSWLSSMARPVDTMHSIIREIDPQGDIRGA